MYKPGIKQGAILTKEQIAAITTNMSRGEVYYLAGLPSIIDPIDNGTVYYAYQVGDEEYSYKKMSAIESDIIPNNMLKIHFENEMVTSMEYMISTKDAPKLP